MGADTIKSGNGQKRGFPQNALPVPANLPDAAPRPRVADVVPVIDVPPTAEQRPS
ncbi:hypothetical protein SAMN04488103_101472 [Gemmobacter aquatilis]|uniref:Uncharacterized protein n=2 Tax=Gemmobacter aquatilis TaxID=933059 RepID=A0A1H7ZE56_9RHOB|nr:hypothetical protein SAMN04488103_101472 [Gemmobacter aquatilis]